MSLSSILDRLAGQPVIPRRRKRLRPARFLVEALETRVLLTIYTVNTTNPGFGGPGEVTLLNAISQVNADKNTSEPDTINFVITLDDGGNPTNAGVQTIKALVLPAITHPVIFDGTTQPGWSPGHPMVDIDGSQAASVGQINGLEFDVGGNTVKGLIINNFQGEGLFLNGKNDPSHGKGPGLNNVIQGNFIGTDASGTTAKPNFDGGIVIYDSSYNLIGGLDANGQLTNGNLVSGNAGNILLETGSDSHNYIEGNYIGTDITGLKPIANALPNFDGIAISPPTNEPNDGFASNNVIGDFDPNETQFNPNGRNIIAGNPGNGVSILGGTGNQVVGNYIGLGPDGATAEANGKDGVFLEDASSNFIGGMQADAGNVISANQQNGVEIATVSPVTILGVTIPLGSDNGANANVLEGNDIGTTANGLAPLPNAKGVVINNGANNVVGDLNGGNVISGNATGVQITGSQATGNYVQNNVVGMSKDFSKPLGNGDGIVINDHASGNFVGSVETVNGFVALLGNTIAGNTGNGVFIAGKAANNQLMANGFGIVEGLDNRRGTSLPGNATGIEIVDAPNNIIGGTTANARNYIDNSQGDGIEIGDDSAITGSGDEVTTGNAVEGNYIGVGNDGSTKYGNKNNGVEIDGASATTIGGNVPGSGNVISGNTGDGVLIELQAAQGNIVAGNEIGASADGTTAVANANGIEIHDGAAQNFVGLVGDAGRNVISGNSDGVVLTNAGPSNAIANNYIGLNAVGADKLTNTQITGIAVFNSPNTIIGGSDSSLGNVVSGNTSFDIVIASGSSGSQILGNYVGTDKSGLSTTTNNAVGIAVRPTKNSTLPIAAGVTISDNTIGGNMSVGIDLAGGTHNDHIEGNYIGQNAEGMLIPNTGIGIYIESSPGNWVGGLQGPGLGNLGNLIAFTAKDASSDADPAAGSGIVIDGAVSTQNFVVNNSISHNQDDGIVVRNGASNNFIGLPGQGNTIVNNQGNGIAIVGDGTNQNQIEANLIGVTAGTDGQQPTRAGNVQAGIGVFQEADGNIIGGTAPGSANVISANKFGVALQDGALANSIQGNRIGTALDGSFGPLLQGFGNSFGVFILASGGNFIGGATGTPGDAPGNTIADNTVGIDFAGSTDVTSDKTYVDLTGSQVLGNVIANNVTDGVEFLNASSKNTIGGPDRPDGNTIHDNGVDGVYVQSGSGDSILNNLIFNNTGLGIHLDRSGGGNNLQVAAQLSLATNGKSTRLAGWLQSFSVPGISDFTPNTTYRIEFFAGSQSPSANGSENDDAEQLLIPSPLTTPEAGVNVTAAGVTLLKTNSSGVRMFDLNLPAGLPAGTVIRAVVTLMTPSGPADTSQFSNAVVVSLDSDGDGQADNIESAAPNGNSQAAGVVAFQDALTPASYVTLQAPSATDPTLQVTFANAWSVPQPATSDANGPPTNTQFGLGFISFTLNNTPVSPSGQPLPFVVTILLPATATPATSYWRYGKTPDNQTDHWYDWVFGQEPDGTGAEFRGNTILLHFLDGGIGDDDLNPNNRTIVDPGSPGFPDPYTVTTTADGGPGSLRQAIENANANPGSRITFDIPGSGPQTIQVLSPLPQITADVTIDGSSEPGFAGTPLVVLDGSQAGTDADGLSVASGSATIQALVINRFSGDGIHVLSTGSARIVGDYIGTDASGKVAEGNGLYGVEIEDDLQSTGDDDDDDDDDGEDDDEDAGGPQPGGPSTVDGGNVISGNTAGGIFIHGLGATGNFVVDNFVGTQADGVSPLGNGGPGVLIGDGATGNDLGFRSADNANTIAFNAGPGVEVLSGGGNLIEANSIFANQGLGIDLGGDGVTPNDTGDTDGLQNYPVLASAVSYGGRTFISGTLNSAADLFYTVDFYASDAADPSGFGQGQFFLGSISVGTDDSGQASFDVNLASAAPGAFITATTSFGNNTSEFSAALKLTATKPLVLIVNTTDDVDDAVPDPTHFSLREAIEAANAHPGQDIIDFDLPNLNRVILPQSALPDITDPVVIDGTSQPGFQGLPLVEIDGSQAGAGADGLQITGGGAVVRGLAIHSFQSERDNLGVLVGGNAIELTGLGGNLIEGNFLGTDVTGTRPLPDEHADLDIFGSPGNVVGGTTAATRNVILSVLIDGYNSDTDQVIEDAGGNLVQGNYIGVDLTGTAALQGGGMSIEVSAANTVGGTAPGAGNLIVGGLAIDDANSNLVQGNLIGTDFRGSIALGGGSVALSGQGLPAELNQIGGSTPAARNVIAGNVIIEGGNASENAVQGNYIGTDITGSVALHAQTSSISGGYAGVDINGAYNQVGGSGPGEGNLISGFVGEGVGAGILLEPAANGNVIQGNLIGTDATGTKPLANLVGIDDRGFGNTIGGAEPGAGNVISGNQEYGLLLQGTGGNIVQGNFIGTDRTGTVALGNGIFTSLNDGVYVTEPGDVIGGSLPGEGNVISANGGNGISVHQAINSLTDASGITVQGNDIGSDVTGALPLGNGGDGIYVSATPNVILGGASLGAGNLISANGGDGVQIVDASADVNAGHASSGAVIQGNTIGADVSGTGRLGNAADGISIVTSYDVASDETVGGVDLGEGNTVAFNGGRGVEIPFGSGNVVRGNDIFGNGGLGLIMDINGTLATYAEDRGVALSQTAPVLTSATFDPQGTVVLGSLSGLPFTRYEIDFFANDAVNPTGFGDGQAYLQSISVLVDDTGSAQFQIALDAAVPVGGWITATATPDTADGNTTPFAQPAPVMAAEPETIQFAAPAYLVTETGGAAVITVTRTGDTSGTATVDYATSDGSAVAGSNYTAASGTLTFQDGEASEIVTIPIEDDGLADGDMSFQVLLSDPSGASLGAVSNADVTIADSDTAGTIQFSSAAYPVVDKGLGNPVFTVTRTGGSQGTVTVDYRATGGTAVGVAAVQLGQSLDADYLDSFGTVTFAPGQTTAQITIPQIQDLIDNSLLTPAYRGPRTIELTLGNPTGGAVLGETTTSTATVDDEENQHGAFDILSQLQVTESDGEAVMEVIRTGQLSTTEEVSYTTVDGTAQTGTNYIATSGTLTFQPGQNHAFIDVPILDDQVVDDPGNFQVVLSDPTGGAFIYDGLGQCDVSILDSDGLPPTDRLVVVEQSIHEASGTALITVERIDGATGKIDDGTTGSLAVDYATSDGTATAGTDYTATSGTLMFAPGQEYATFSVPILPGLDFPGDATFFVTLSNLVGNAVIDGENPATETIYGTPGQAEVASANYSVAENNASLTITVTFTPAPGAQFGVDSTDHYLPLTVDYSTQDGTATAGADYTAVSGTLSFYPSAETSTITVPILNDLLAESNETFFLRLSDPTGGMTLGEAATTTITILDEDSARSVPSTTTLKSDLSGGSIYGQTVTFTAVVAADSGTPTGSVDFVDTTTGQDLGTEELALVDGVDEARVQVSNLDVRSHTIVASYTSDTDSFVSSHDSLTQSVAPATLTVKADDKTMVEGTTLPPLTDTITGFINGDASSVVSGAANLSTTATSASGVGSYDIKVTDGTLGAANYTFALVNGTLTITAGGNTPVLTLVHDATTSTTEGLSVTLTSALLETTDSDSSVPAPSIIYTLVDAPTLGTLADDGVSLAAGDTFSQQDINDKMVTYQSAEEGADPFAFTVASGGASPISGTLAIMASDPSVVATGGLTYSATEGTVGAGEPMATFTDPGGAEALSDYAATIDWGDGTSATDGTLSLDPAGHVFTVSGAHTYGQDGTFTVAVTITHGTAMAVTVTSTAAITSATGTGEGGIAASGVAVSGYEFSALTGVTVATFTDTDVSLAASDFSALIDWGDGTTSAGSVMLASDTYAVTGSHEYLDEGHYEIKVSIEQTAGPVTGGTSALVGAVATIHEQRLADGTAGTPDQNYIQEIYRDLFGRQAEMQGLGYWVAELAQGVPRQQVAFQMVRIASFEEFQHDTVAALYEQYLGRVPDSGGLAYWSAYLYDGGTIEGMSQALVSSQEYWQSRGGGMADGFLKALFRDALGRQIDPAALTYFEGLVAEGASSAEIAEAVFASDEYHRLRVNSLFEQFLDRPADAGALAYFAGELDEGERDEIVISQLLASDEYYEHAQI
jgi:parallel beta-helix repeat protein